MQVSETVTTGARDRVGKIERLKRPALWLLVVLVIATVVFGVLDTESSFEPPYLMFSLNILFLGVPGFFITAIAIRSFLRTGTWTVLWLGIGTLSFALATLEGSFLIYGSTANVAISVHNLIAFFAAALFFIGAFFSFSGTLFVEDRTERLVILLVVYLGALAFIVYLTFVNVNELLPTFFIEGQGGTSIRQMVVATAAVLFILAGLGTIREYLRSKSHLLYWYSLGLILMAMGMGGILMQTELGTPLNWMGRFAQLLAGAYLMAAVLVAVGEARASHLPAGEALARLLSATQVRLKETQARFQMIFEHAELGIALGDLDGRIIESNPALEHMLGYTKEELHNKAFRDFTHPDDLLIELPQVQDLISGKRGSYEVEKRYIRKDGQTIWVQLLGHLLRSDKGEPLMGVALVENITERKKAEAALRDSELRYRTVADKTYDFEFWINPEGKFIYASPSCERVYGFTPAHFMADPGLRRRIVYPEDIATFDRHVAEEAKRISGEVEYRILGSDGTHRWIAHACQPVCDEHGEYLGFRGSNRDITERKKAEEALKKLNEELENKVLQRTKDVTTERQRLFDVLETIPTMVCLLTPDYRVPFANKSFREKFGEANGRFCYEYCFRRKEPCEFCETYEVLKTGKPHHWEVEMFDGTIVDVHDFPFNDVDGTPMILEMDLDITERRKSEAALRQASQYTRSLIEASLDPLVTISSEGKITDVNEGTVSATGFSRQELIGSDFSDYFTDPEKARAGYQQVFAKGYVTDYPLTIRHRDGRSMDVLYNATVYKDNSGNVLGVFAAARDVTERNRAEAALKELNESLEKRVAERTAELENSEERFRALSETSPVGVGVSSADGILLYANPSYELILGYGHGELTGTKASDLYWNPEDRRSWVSTINDSGVVRNFETRLKRKDGTPIWVSISASPILYGGRQAVMGTIQDITARKKADELKDEFIGMVSHELKTPLTVMMGALHTATAKGVPEEEAKELIQEAVISTNTLASIVENLLELSRAQANRLELHREQSDVGKTAREVVQKLHGQSAIHRLIVDFPEGLPTVTVDPVRVERILFNLVENAIKYSPKGGEVRISAHEEDDKLVVCVSDQGPGISQEDQKKLFQSFEQLAVSNRRAMQGVGLGLKVCRTLVEAHGGRIWVESEPGNGSSFFFTIPRR
jgi:PAS domain S-box-containing protein